MSFLVATKVIASRPPKHQPTGTPHARANLLYGGGGHQKFVFYIHNIHIWPNIFDIHIRSDCQTRIYSISYSVSCLDMNIFDIRIW